MKKMFNSFLAIVLALVLLFVAGLVLIPAQVSALWQQVGLPAPVLQRLTGGLSVQEPTHLYGTLEARTTLVMGESAARAIEVRVEEGDAVRAGDVLILLDESDARAQVAAAEEALAAAKAARAAVAAGPDASTRVVAQRAVDAARTQVGNARRSLKHTEAMLEEPQALNSQIAQTAALVSVAQAGVDAAEVAVHQVDVLLAEAQQDGSREGKYKVKMLQEQRTAAQALLQGAQARRDGLYRVLALLKSMKKEPLALDAQVHQAQSQLKLAQAGLKVALAQQALQVAPPAPEAVAVAQVDVQRAQAALDLARWQVEQLEIVAPASGVVQNKMIAAGEMEKPGQPLLSIAETDPLELWVYVPQQDLHRVQVGQQLAVVALALPQQQLSGEVFFIASQAQFRPNNVLNPDDRGDMVFLVKLHVANPDGVLKPGMPADVLLEQ